MKSASEVLINHIHSTKEFLTIDLYSLKVDVDNSTVSINLCNNATDLVIDGITFYSGKGIINRTQTKLTNELSVDSVTLNLYVAGDAFEGLGDLQKSAHDGLLDHSVLHIYRAYYNLYTGEYVDKIEMFVGDCQVVQAGGLNLQLKASSDAVSLNLKFPVRKFYPQASYVGTGSGGIVYSEGDNNRSCMIPLKPNKRALL